jgi:hypothetical protein
MENRCAIEGITESYGVSVCEHGTVHVTLGAATLHVPPRLLAPLVHALIGAAEALRRLGIGTAGDVCADRKPYA